MKALLIFAILFLMTCSGYCRDYREEPVHSDLFMSTITIPMENDLKTLLKDRPVDLNIVLNYFKTLEFCDGVVSRSLYNKFNESKGRLPEGIGEKLATIEKMILEKKRRTLTIVDLQSNEYYLPIKFLQQ